MKRINLNLSKRKWLLIISCIVCFILAISLDKTIEIYKNKLPHEKVALLWDPTGDTAHVSMYFTENEKTALKQDLKNTEYMLESWYHSLAQKLTEASLSQHGVKNANARNLVYGYHATGKVTLTYNKRNVEVNAYGVGGDFFQFHPVKLLRGGYFSQSDLMQDKVILDAETAWQLFGSYDVVGMYVTIQDIPHIVVGVYERERSKLMDAAGNAASSVFVSHSSLAAYGSYNGLEGVEYLLPNPVSEFGKGLVTELAGQREVVVVEHQNRFGVIHLFKMIKQLPTRSMQVKGVTYPYWENMARSYEDLLARLFLLKMIFWIYLIIVLICVSWRAWLRRTWRARYLY